MSSRPVIVGTDGTGPSRDAVREAAREAARRGAPLRIAHVFDWDPDEDRYGIGNEGIDVSRRLAEAVVDRAVRQAREIAPHLTIDTDTLIGNPAARLLDLAAEAGVMVLGHRPRGGPALRLGAVGRSVATHADCPVLTVCGRTEPTGPVVAGVDDSPTADLVLATAFEEAAARNCPLTVRHAYRPADAAHRAALESHLTPWRAKYPEVEVTTTVTSGGAGPALVDASYRARLVVVGSRGRGAVRAALLGSTGRHLLHHAACPVLITRPAPAPHSA
jgi:nucleotide-binding universal stress UspA family protein